MGGIAAAEGRGMHTGAERALDSAVGDDERCGVIDVEIEKIVVSALSRGRLQ